MAQSEWNPQPISWSRDREMVIERLGRIERGLEKLDTEHDGTKRELSALNTKMDQIGAKLDLMAYKARWQSSIINAIIIAATAVVIYWQAIHHAFQ